MSTFYGDDCAFCSCRCEQIHIKTAPFYTISCLHSHVQHMLTNFQKSRDTIIDSVTSIPDMNDLIFGFVQKPANRLIEMRILRVLTTGHINIYRINSQFFHITQCVPSFRKWIGVDKYFGLGLELGIQQLHYCFHTLSVKI